MELDRIDLNKLRVFHAVAEHGGVTAAARRLALTPSAVSQSLSALEGTLALQLFDRVGRSLVLTRQGRTLVSAFASYEHGLEAALSQIRNEDQVVRGTLRVGLSLGVPRARLAHFLAAFTVRYEAASIRLSYGSHAELDDGLLAGRLDCVVSFDPGSRAVGRIESTHLFEQELVAVEKDRPRRRLTLAELRTTPIVDYYHSSPLIHRWIAHHFRGKKIPVRVRVWAATTDLVLDLVLGGVGLAILPRHMVAPHVSSRDLREIPTTRKPLRDSIWLKERATTRRDPLAAAFRDAAIAQLTHV